MYIYVYLKVKLFFVVGIIPNTYDLNNTHTEHAFSTLEN